MASPEATPPGDPSMEDILASIRRILDDGEPGVPPASAAAEPSPDSVFLLDPSMLIEEPAPMPEPEPNLGSPEPAYSPLDAGEHAAEPLVAASTAAAASASLGALARVVGQRGTQVYRGGPTLEDMVREELRPLVAAWLDENLAPMVERLVSAEIERVTRTR